MWERVCTAWDASVACSFTAMSFEAQRTNHNKQYLTDKRNRIHPKIHSTHFDPILGDFQPKGFKCAISPMCSGSLGCRQPLSSRLRSVATSLETRLTNYNRKSAQEIPKNCNAQIRATHTEPGNPRGWGAAQMHLPVDLLAHRPKKWASILKAREVI